MLRTTAVRTHDEKYATNISYQNTKPKVCYEQQLSKHTTKSTLQSTAVKTHDIKHATNHSCQNM